MLYVIRAVRERKPFVDEILKQIPEAIVYWDDDRNAREAFVNCCKDIVKDQPCIMLEDDIILTSNFKEKIEKVVNECPDIMISFFSLSKKQTTTCLRKGRELCSSLCIYFPKGLAKKIVDFYPTWDGKQKYISAIDYLIGDAYGRGKSYMLYCPSLVQHRDCKSAINSRRSSKRQSITFVE